MTDRFSDPMTRMAPPSGCAPRREGRCPCGTPSMPEEVARVNDPLWERARELQTAARAWQEHKRDCAICREWRDTGYICPDGRGVIGREAAARARLFELLDRGEGIPDGD